MSVGSRVSLTWISIRSLNGCVIGPFLSPLRLTPLPPLPSEWVVWTSSEDLVLKELK